MIVGGMEITDTVAALGRVIVENPRGREGLLDVLFGKLPHFLRLNKVKMKGLAFLRLQISVIIVDSIGAIFRGEDQPDSMK